MAHHDQPDAFPSLSIVALDDDADFREYLETLVKDGKWDKSPPGPELPREIVSKTLEKYAEALNRLTG